MFQLCLLQLCFKTFKYKKTFRAVNKIFICDFMTCLYDKAFTVILTENPSHKPPSPLPTRHPGPTHVRVEGRKLRRSFWKSTFSSSLRVLRTRAERRITPKSSGPMTPARLTGCVRLCLAPRRDPRPPRPSPEWSCRATGKHRHPTGDQ